MVLINFFRLSQARKKRTDPATLRSVSEISGFVETGSYALHGSVQPGITSCDISVSNPSLIVTGGVDGTVNVFDMKEKKLAATLSGHTKKVNQVLFHKQRNAVVSASADKTARVWVSDGGDYQCVHVLKGHSASVAGIDIHPTGEYVLSAGADAGWALWDIPTGEEIFKSPVLPNQKPYFFQNLFFKLDVLFRQTLQY